MDDDITTKPELQAALDRAWADLQRVIDAADTGEMMTKTDAAGWNVRDHLAHLAVWANGVIGMARDGRPQWNGLGLSRDRFDFEDIDGMNEEIRQRTIDWPLERTREQLAGTHAELARVVDSMSGNDLQKPCSAYVPDGQDFAIIHKIDGNGPHHYDEHRVWIERILAS